MSFKNLHYWLSWPPGWVKVLLLFLFINKVTPTYIFDYSYPPFATFPKWDYTNFSLNFEFLTNNTDGLLVYTDDGESSFVKLKLLNGVLFLQIRFHNQITNMTSSKKLNDSKFHEVMIMISDENIFLEVDGSTIHRTLQRNESVSGNILSNNVYFGGVPLTYIPRLETLSLPSVMFEARFQGKIKRIFYLDKFRKILISPPDLDTSSVTIEREKYLYNCHLNNSCLNGQKCFYIQNPEECDCWDFGYQGVKCEKENIAAQFGPSVGMITIADVPMDMTDIHLSFNFITNSSDCVLIYLENSANKKYLQVKLSGGKLIAGYWIEKFLRVLTVKGNFADLQYHTVNFIQKGKYITLNIDTLIADSSKDEELIELILSGSNLIEMGGTRNPETNEIDESFNGIFSDVVLGNMNILKLITDNNPHVSIDGNVTVKNFTLPSPKPTSTGSHQPITAAIDQEEDMFSGSGSASGCANGDCDQEEVMHKVSEPRLHSPPVNSNQSDPHHPGCKDGDDDCDFFIQESFTVFQEFNSTENQTADLNDIEVTENPISRQSKKNTSALNIYLILGLVAEGVILLIILTFAIYKFSQCRAHKKEKQQYNLVPNTNYPESNDNKLLDGNYTIRENNFYE